MTPCSLLSTSLIWILSAWLAIGSLPAQELSEVETVSLNFKVVSLDRSIEDLLYYSGNEWQQLNVPTGYPAGGFSYEGPRSIGFYDSIPEKTLDGELPPPDISVLLPPDTHEALVLVFATATNTGRVFQGVAIDFSLEAFPGGGVLLYNLTGRKIDGRIGSARLEMEENQAFFFEQLKPDLANDQAGVVLGFYDENNQWQRAVSTVWRADSRFRIIRLIMNDGNQTDAIRFRTIYERTPSG